MYALIRQAVLTAEFAMMLMMMVVVVVLVLSGLAKLQQEQFQILSTDTQASTCYLQRSLVSAVNHSCSEIEEARP